jgi:dolichol-phosphate mannosyltransferase
VRALVTGAAGFVGANLARALRDQGHDVVAWHRPGGEPWRLEPLTDDVEVVEVDVTDADALERGVDWARPDWVFHLAAHGAYSWQQDAERIMEVNLASTVRLLDACARRDVAAFVHAGSSSEYGFKDHAPSEDELPEPNSDYAVMKAAATLHCRSIAQRLDVHAVTLRLYSIYGPWEEPGRLMPTLVVRGLEHRLPPLVDPDTARDFVTTADLVRAFVLAAERSDLPRGTVLNIGSGVQTTLRDVVEVAREELDIEDGPEWGSEPPRSWDTTAWVSDPRRAQELLGWRAGDDLRSGFRVLVDWMRDHPELWQRYGVSSQAPL